MPADDAFIAARPGRQWRAFVTLALLALFSTACGPPAQELIPKGVLWSYLDDGSDPGPRFASPAFDASAWRQGPAQLGYGEGDEATAIDFGPDPQKKHVTTYFRRSFSVDRPSTIQALELSILADAGAVVYLNGAEVLRLRLPSGPVAHDTLANAVAAQGIFDLAFVDPSVLVDGINVIAVEVHQAGRSSAKLSFDLGLGAQRSALVRGPYVQRAAPTRMVVRWNTSRSVAGQVRYGPSPDQLTRTVTGPVATVHEIELRDLRPETTYFYAVGSADGILAGGDGHFFRTSPPIGTARPTRIWVIGDSGRPGPGARDVRDAYLRLARSRRADVWLMLGDNAHDSGTEAEYQSAVFDLYADVLRTTPLWPTLGDRDALSSDPRTQQGPYFDAFSLPRSAEAGGVPSGTETYYSFDYSNIHFVSLSSVGSEGQSSEPMLTWLARDLAATDQDWIIAYLHHPPYSKGAHDSDLPGPETDVREKLLPILEASGVDLVLTGHSDSYERSVLLDRHYGTSNTLDPRTMVLDRGDGRARGAGPYRKPTPGRAAHEGTVYVVAGSASATDPAGRFDHPAMFTSFPRLGSLVIDVDGLALDAAFVRDGGGVDDAFRIEKGPPLDSDRDGVPDSSDSCPYAPGLDPAASTCPTPAPSGYEGLRPYAGDEHIHSSVALHWAEMDRPGFDPARDCVHSYKHPSEVYDLCRANGLDFCVVSHHSNLINAGDGWWKDPNNPDHFGVGTDPRGYPLPRGGFAATELEWLHAIADDRNDPGKFVAFYGIEFTTSHPLLPACQSQGPAAPLCGGHKIAICPHSGIAQTCGAARRGAPCGDSETGFYAFLRENDCLGSAAHPCQDIPADFTPLGVGAGGFDDDAMSGYEMAQRCEKNDPADAPAQREAKWRNVLARGLKLGVVAGSDDHNRPPQCGSSLGPGNAGRMMCWASSLTRSALMTALREMRCYWVERASRPRVEFSLEGHPMGATLPRTTLQSPGRVRVHVAFENDAARPIKVSSFDVVHNGELVLQRQECRDRCLLDLAVESPDPSGYWYVRFTRGLDGTDLEIATSPIWIE